MFYTQNSYRKYMLKYYLSKEYRKVYKQLDTLGVLNDSFNIDYVAYLKFFSEKQSQDLINNHFIEILQQRKASPAATIKTLMLVHAWLQTTRILQNPSSALSLLNTLLKQTQILLSQRRPDKQNQGVAKSAVLSSQGSRYNVQIEKQIFLLQQVAVAYINYLQKIVSIFEFYHSLKHNFVRLMHPSQTWALLNIFKMITKIVSKLPQMCRFIRKSYRPLSEAIGEAMDIDSNCFYPKLYKHFYSQAAKLQNQCRNQENKKENSQNVQGCVTISCMLEEIRQVNTDLNDFYGSVMAKSNQRMKIPKMVNPNGKQFTFLQKIAAKNKLAIKTVIQMSESTPKFHMPSKYSYQSEQNQQEMIAKDVMLRLFQDLSNQQVMTFRKEKTSIFIQPILQEEINSRSLNQ